MSNEAWLNGELDGFSPLARAAAHALVQAITDLERFAPHLSIAQLLKSPNNSSSVTFHLRHFALMMPAAHALVQTITDLERVAPHLST